jgi:adhesin/invasin
VTIRLSGHVAAALVLAVAVWLSAGSAGAAGNVCPSENRPNELVLVGGSGQTAQLGKPFETPLQVQLANTNGCPLTGNLAGISVDFDAPGSGPSGRFSSTGSTHAVVGTNAQGVATAPSFVANDTAGAYTVDAHSDYGTVELSLSNTASGIAAAIAAVGPTAYEGATNSQFPQALQARVVDANGNPVQGATVSFAVVLGATGAGASFLGGQATATTDSNGLATSPPLLANAVPGKFMVAASVEGVPAVLVYAFDNHAVAVSLAAPTAKAMRARVDSGYGAPLRAVVLDATGQPVEGVSVAFTIVPASSGAGASFTGGAGQATVLTDATGVAESPRVTANKTAGSFEATAATTGAQPVRYALTNLAGTPATVTAGAGTGQTAPGGTRFVVPLAVTVVDKDGNPIAGAVVTFTAPSKGPSGRFGKKGRRVRVVSNAKGVAVAPAFRASRKAGGYVVTASVRGTSMRVAFALVNEPAR